jgi:hypothetical protein
VARGDASTGGVSGVEAIGWGWVGGGVGNLTHGVHVGGVDGLHCRDGGELDFDQVESLVSLSILLHSQEAEGCEDLTVQVPFHEVLWML